MGAVRNGQIISQTRELFSGLRIEPGREAAWESVWCSKSGKDGLAWEMGPAKLWSAGRSPILV